ncbi:hypothetical protein QZH41_016070 [Actinostola sp. cb2023]|nr:hypothetical protein QZH41_016070 [Actinostola sp. cb2023]
MSNSDGGGKDMTDETMITICKQIWDKYGYTDEYSLEIMSYKHIMEKAEFSSCKQAMKSILRYFQPEWFLEELVLNPYDLDEQGNIVVDGDDNNVNDNGDESGNDDDGDKNGHNGDGDDGGDDDDADDENNIVVDGDDNNVNDNGDESGNDDDGDKNGHNDDDGGDDDDADDENNDADENEIEEIDESKDEAGEDEDEDEDDEDDEQRKSWKKTFNKPIGKEIFKKLKSLFADKSEGFIKYCLSDGCFNENDAYAHSLWISDTAVILIKQFYEL